MTAVRRNWQRLRALSRADRLVLAEAWLALLFFDVALHLVPFPRVQRLAEGRPGHEPAPGGSAATIQVANLTILVDIAARHHLHLMTCLRRALALQWLLGRRGVPSQLCLGVRRTEAGIVAHAWLEHDGRLIGELPAAVAGYTVLSAGPSSPLGRE